MSRPVVAVFNSNDDIVEMLRIALERAGLIVVSGDVGAIRRGRQRLSDFVEEHNPAVILYDVAPPYDRSWHFLEHLRQTPGMRGRGHAAGSCWSPPRGRRRGGAGAPDRQQARRSWIRSSRRSRTRRAGWGHACRRARPASESGYTAETGESRVSEVVSLTNACRRRKPAWIRRIRNLRVVTRTYTDECYWVNTQIDIKHPLMSFLYHR